MPSKDQLSDQLNEMMDTNIDWSQLRKSDLEQLVELADEGLLIEPLMKVQVKKRGEDKFEELVDEWRPGAVLGGVMNG